MEYICKIYNDDGLPQHLMFLNYCYQLPIFELTPPIIRGGNLGYHCYFYKESRYTPDLICVYPPKKLTEEQFNTINEKWNYCVENKLPRLEFDL